MPQQAKFRGGFIHETYQIANTNRKCTADGAAGRDLMTMMQRRDILALSSNARIKVLHNAEQSQPANSDRTRFREPQERRGASPLCGNRNFLGMLQSIDLARRAGNLVSCAGDERTYSPRVGIFPSLHANIVMLRHWRTVEQLHAIAGFPMKAQSCFSNYSFIYGSARHFPAAMCLSSASKTSDGGPLAA